MGGGVSKNSNLQGMKIDNRSKDIYFFPVEVDNPCINIRIHNGSSLRWLNYSNFSSLAQFRSECDFGHSFREYNDELLFVFNLPREKIHYRWSLFAQKYPK